MSPNARRRYTKIIEQQSSQKDRELIGGLKNALERGEDIEKIKKSFTAAGYKKSQIDVLTEEMTKTISQPEKTESIPISKKQIPSKNSKSISLITTPNQLPQKKHVSKKFMIILIIIGMLILAIAGAIGFFWDSIF